MKQLLTALLVLLVIGQSTSADETQPGRQQLIDNLISNLGETQIAVFGVGTKTCAEYVEHYDNEYLKLLYVQYLTGYVTGYNSAVAAYNAMLNTTGNTSLGLNSAPGFALSVYNYCKENPLKPLSDGAFNLIAELARMAQK